MSIPDKILLGLGALCILATIAVVLLINPTWTPTSVIATIGLMWAEVILFGGCFFLKKQAPPGSSVFLRVGASFVVVVAAVASFLVSAAFFPLPSVMIPWFFAIQLILLVALVCIVLLIVFFEKRFRSSDEKATAGIARVAQRSAQVSAYAKACMDPDLKQRLERCADDLKFMDSTVQVEADAEIDKKIDLIYADLSANSPEGSDRNLPIAALTIDIQDLERAIAVRKDEATLAKRGGF